MTSPLLFQFFYFLGNVQVQTQYLKSSVEIVLSFLSWCRPAVIETNLY